MDKENVRGCWRGGEKFLYSEFKYLLKNQPSMIPQSMMNNMFKIIGYKLGQNYSKLPLSLVKNAVCINDSGKRKITAIISAY